MNPETLFAAIGLAVCVALLARMAIGSTRRERLDAWVTRRTRIVSAGAQRLWQRRRVRGQAERETDALIRRARRHRSEVTREGNVIRPRSFNDSGADGAPDGRDRRDH